MSTAPQIRLLSAFSDSRNLLTRSTHQPRRLLFDSNSPWPPSRSFASSKSAPAIPYTHTETHEAALSETFPSPSEKRHRDSSPLNPHRRRHHPPQLSQTPDQPVHSVQSGFVTVYPNPTPSKLLRGCRATHARVVAQSLSLRPALTTGHSSLSSSIPFSERISASHAPKPELSNPEIRT